MKKLLTMLGAIGLTATASMSVVACGNVKDSKVKFSSLSDVASNWDNNIRKYANFYTGESATVEQSKLLSIIATGFDNPDKVFEQTKWVGKLVMETATGTGYVEWDGSTVDKPVYLSIDNSMIGQVNVFDVASTGANSRTTSFTFTNDTPEMSEIAFMIVDINDNYKARIEDGQNATDALKATAQGGLVDKLIKAGLAQAMNSFWVNNGQEPDYSTTIKSAWQTLNTYYQANADEASQMRVDMTTQIIAGMGNTDKSFSFDLLNGFKADLNYN